jgi:hypothetical protein
VLIGGSEAERREEGGSEGREAREEDEGFIGSEEGTQQSTEGGGRSVRQSWMVKQG